MSDVNIHRPAFPQIKGERNQVGSVLSESWHTYEPGLSMRDYFAAKALQGLLSDENTHIGYKNRKTGRGWPDDENEFREAVAFVAYSMADAMLRAREVKQ